MAEQERIEVEKIADDRYRLRFHGQVMTLDSQALVDIASWIGLHEEELQRQQPYGFDTGLGERTHEDWSNEE